jgi:eukaryotic-like serine/threonine-protein kinase
MGFFNNFRADRLIDQIKSAKDVLGAEAQKSVARLKELGPAAIEAVLAALPDADKQTTVALVDVLSSMATAKTLPMYIEALIQGSPRVIAGVSWALSTSRGFPPHLLLEALARPGISKSAILEVIGAHRARFSVRELLTSAYTQEPNEKAALFKIVGEVVDENGVPELLGRLQGKDTMARLQILTILARFDRPDVRSAVQGQLGDSNKLVRSAALAALARQTGPVEVERIAGMLCDPEIEVQNRAVEVLINARDPQTIRHLVPVLKDENEYSRRAAVEVLNEVGDANSVKFLLAAIKDDDWWVRSRAGDALGKIGGPKVIDAVLELARDKDDDIRRAAIEILNQTKDERAIDQLIIASRDADWWVSERAVDALAAIGNPRALPRILEMLRTSQPKALPVVLRAIGKLGTAENLGVLKVFLGRPEKDIRIEAMAAIAKVVTEEQQDQARTLLQPLAAATDGGPEPDRGAHRHWRGLRLAPRDQQAATRRDHAHAAGRLREGGRADPAAGGRGRAGRRPAGHRHAQSGRHGRGPLQVYRPHRQGRFRYRAADGRHGGRRAADPQVPQPERGRGRRGHEALRPRAALLAQDHAQQRDPNL